MAEAVLIPLLNPNEPEAILAALHVQEGQPVSKGGLLATFETTKSAADLIAERDGFIVGLSWSEGQTAKAGEVLCYIAESPDWAPPPALRDKHALASDAYPDLLPANLRITKPALELARQKGIDLTVFSAGQLVTEEIVRRFTASTHEETDFSLREPDFDPAAVIVYGGGGHGKALIDLLRALRVYRIVGVIDDGLPAGGQIMGVPVLGGASVLPDLFQSGVRQAVNAVGGIGNIATRIQVFDQLTRAGFVCPAVVHPAAYIEPSAALSAGVQVFPHAYIGSEARIGFGSIVNTGAIVSHDCVLGNYANISPGAMLAGEVQVGEGALVGMGATINLRVTIGAGARIGNSAVVKENVAEKGIVRAGTTWPASSTPGSLI